jgi:hypothetical protein
LTPHKHGDDDSNVLQWCQGTVVKVLKGEKNYVAVEIKCYRKCLREGDSETSQDKLMRAKLNSNKHKQGIWPGKLASYGQLSWECLMLACQADPPKDRHLLLAPTCRQHVSQHVGSIVPTRVATGANMTQQLCRLLTCRHRVGKCWQKN